MPAHRPVFNRFTPDDRFWRMDWVGGVTRPDEDSEEIQVAVYLSPATPVKDLKIRGLNRSLVVSKERIRCWANISVLKYLEIGSWWRYGRCVLPRLPTHIVTSTIDTSLRLEYIKLKDFILHRDAYTENSDGTRNIYEQSLLKALFTGSHLDEIGESSIAVFSDQKGVRQFAIPCMELIRRYYCFTRSGTRALFNGEYPELVKSWRERKGRYFSDDDAVTLCLRASDFGNWPLVAYAESHRNGWSAVNRVHDSLIRQKVIDSPSSTNNLLLHPEALFPINGKLKVSHRSHRFPGNSTLNPGDSIITFPLIYNITAHELDPPETNKIRVASLRDDTSVVHVDLSDVNGPTIGPGPLLKPRKSVDIDVQPGGASPLSRSLKLLPPETNRFFKDDPAVEHFPSGRWNEHIIDINDQVILPPEGDIHTITGGDLITPGGKKNVARVEQEPAAKLSKHRREALEASFENLQEKLEVLALNYTCSWQFAEVPSELIDEQEGVTKFPARPINKLSSWTKNTHSFLYPAGMNIRRGMVVEVQLYHRVHDASFLYLIDIEPKKKGECVMHLFASATGLRHKLSEEQIRLAFEAVAKNEGKRLSGNTSGLWFSFMKHSSVKEEVWAANFLGKFSINRKTYLYIEEHGEI